MLFASGHILAIQDPLKKIERSQVKNAIWRLLQDDFADLGEPSDRLYYGPQDQAGIPLQLGRFRLHIRGRRVTVNPQGRQAGDARIVRRLKQAIGDRLAELAMLALGRRVSMALLNAGYQIDQALHDRDGALVVELGVAAILIELDGCATIIIRDDDEAEAGWLLWSLLAVMAEAGAEATLSDQGFFSVPDSYDVIGKR